MCSSKHTELYITKGELIYKLYFNIKRFFKFTGDRRWPLSTGNVMICKNVPLAKRANVKRIT